MDFFIDFLVNNYVWFLMITIVLFFALVGYIVDSKEQKPATVFDSPLEMQRNLTNLAVSAQNKTLSSAVNPNSGMNYPNQQMNPMMNQVPQNSYPQQNYGISQANYGNVQNQNWNSNPYSNYNQTMPNSTMNMGSNLTNQSTSFEVLGK